MKLCTATAWLVLSATACFASTAITLKDTVEVRSSTVSLSDLLPDKASPELRARAEKICVAPAPVIGATGLISQSQLQRAVAESGLELQVPEHVRVTRWQRDITPSEAREALTDALEEHDVPESAIRGTVTLSAHTGCEHPQLLVTHFDLNRANSVLRFRMRIANEPELHEFWAEARVDSQAFPAELKAAAVPNAHEARPAPAKKAPAEIVAHAMKPALLTVYGRGFEFTTSVVPLQNGARGQTIRVREEGTGRILQAQVVGPGQLQNGQPVAMNQE